MTISLDPDLTVTVPTGARSEYVFAKHGTGLKVHIQGEGSDRMREYHLFYGEKPTTALIHLVERCHQLEQFFKAVQRLSIFELDTLNFDSVMRPDDLDADDGEAKEEAMELMTTMLEEAERRDEMVKDGHAFDGLWVQDDDQ